MRQSWQRIFQICLILATPITLSPQAWAVLWSVSAPFQPMIFKPRHWLAVAGTRGGKRSKNKSRYVKHWAVIIAKERELISSDPPPPMSSQGRPVKPLKCPPFVPFQGTADYTGTAPVCSHHKRFFFVVPAIVVSAWLVKGRRGGCTVRYTIKLRVDTHEVPWMSMMQFQMRFLCVCMLTFENTRIYSHVTYKWLKYLDSWSPL